MIGIIQRFGMATELSHRKITVFRCIHKNFFWEIGIDNYINNQLQQQHNETTFENYELRGSAHGTDRHR